MFYSIKKASPVVNALTFIFFLPVTSFLLRAAPPPSLEGWFYSERIVSGTFSYHRIIELSAAKTFQELVVVATERASPYNALARSGTYTYEVTGDATARLQLGGDDPISGANVLYGSRVLEFRADNKGNVHGRLELYGGTFEVSPIAARSQYALVNQSTRGSIASDRPIRLGFVLQKTSLVLIRAIGPGLIPFGVSAAQDPNLRIEANPFGPRPPHLRAPLFNDDWTSAESSIVRSAQLVGAFPLSSGSKDALVLASLPAGTYVATAAVPEGDTGDVLIELYLVFSENSQ